MARKSRRTQNAAGNAEALSIAQAVMSERKENQLSTAAYGRLSVENGGDETDETLQTQMSMLYEYIDRHPDLKLTDSYMDNGYTGTNFDRPEFVRLMDDVRSGRIQCIVVKDLSRFGRNYLETGYYIETLFPHLNVRFIAVNDDFDSIQESDRDSLSVPIKNMVNALYAKDISKKICAAAEVRASRPDVIPCGTAPFGYMVSDDRKHYLVDEEVAPYVRMIYRWALDGVGNKNIAKRMELLGAPTPGQRRAGQPADSSKWNAGTVLKVLQNPNYTGDMHMGRMKQALYKSEKVRWTSPEEWKVRKNTHEPLVTRDDYQKVQELIASYNKRKMADDHFYVEQRERMQDHFTGLVYCGECGRRMDFRRYMHNYATLEKAVSCYGCRKKSDAQDIEGHVVYEDFLKIVVMDQIQVLIKSMCDRKKLLDKMNTSSGGKRSMLSAEKKMVALTVKIAETEERQGQLYENFADGLLEQEDYQSLKERYIADRQRMQAELQKLEQQRRKLEKTVNCYKDLVKHLESYLDKRDFNEALVKELVERIVYYPSGGIEVIFKCNDVAEEIARLLEGSD